jgi:hypothetical protein
LENLEFKGNQIICSRFLETENKPAAISLTACKKVRIEMNNFDPSDLLEIDAVKMT